MMKRLVIFLGLIVGIAHAQLTNSPGVIYVGSAPAGACTTAPPLQVLTTSGAIYSCNNGTWTNITAGGSGTVTSVTFTGDGVVDSSTPSSAVTTSGTVTATLLTQTANTAFGNFTGSTAAPSFTATTGTGSPVAATSPTLVTPALGTPSTLVITNATGTCSTCVSNSATLDAPIASPTFTGTVTTPFLGLTGNGAASTAEVSSTGTLFTGGSGTTTFPLWLIQPTGATAETGWSTGGTFFGINSASGFTGNFIDAHLNNAASSFAVSAGGNVSATGNLSTSGGVIISAGATAELVNAFGAVAVAAADGVAFSSAGNAGGTKDTGLDRSAAGIVEVNLGTAAGSGGSLKSAGLISGGTAFTASGCGTAGAITGGASAGSFTVGTGATNCTFTITINGATGLTAPHGWIANADDTTANIHCVNSTTVSTTTVVFVCTGTIATSDLIKFSAIAY